MNMSFLLALDIAVPCNVIKSAHFTSELKSQNEF